MQVATARARRAKLGPFPIPRTAGRVLTAPHHGRIRSGFAGQGNAIFFPKDAQVRQYRTITLNTNVFCEERGARFGLTPKEDGSGGSASAASAAGPPVRVRRIARGCSSRTSTRDRASAEADLRLADAETRRAINFVIKSSELEESLIVAGDFNITIFGPLRDPPGADHRPPRIPLERGHDRDRQRPPAARGGDFGAALDGRGAHLQEADPLGSRSARGRRGATAEGLRKRPPLPSTPALGLRDQDLDVA